jgi:hypothetical protein
LLLSSVSSTLGKKALLNGIDIRKLEDIKR